MYGVFFKILRVRHKEGNECPPSSHSSFTHNLTNYIVKIQCTSTSHKVSIQLIRIYINHFLSGFFSLHIVESRSCTNDYRLCHQNPKL